MMKYAFGANYNHLRIKVITTLTSKPTGGNFYIEEIYKYIPYEYILNIKSDKRFIFGSLRGLRIFFNQSNNLYLRKYLRSKFENIKDTDIIHNICPQMPKVNNSLLITTIHHINHYIFNVYWNRSVVKNSDYIIAVSNFTKNQILTYTRCLESKIKVIENGIDTDTFCIKKTKEGGEFILFPNGLRDPFRKGTYFIMPILKKLFDKYKKLTCIITGPSSLNAERILQSLNRKIIYKGFVSKEELAELYRQAQLIIFPSNLEGFGLVPLESIACGGVPISSNVGAVKEYLINGVNGFILPLEQREWFDKMKELIENESLRKEIRKNSKQIKIRSWEDCAKEHLAFFKEVINENP